MSERGSSKNFLLLPRHGEASLAEEKEGTTCSCKNWSYIETSASQAFGGFGVKKSGWNGGLWLCTFGLESVGCMGARVRAQENAAFVTREWKGQHFMRIIKGGLACMRNSSPNVIKNTQWKGMYWRGLCKEKHWESAEKSSFPSPLDSEAY